MSDGEDSVEKLVRALEAAGEDKLLSVVAMVDRLANRGALDAVLDHFRPRLAVVRPPRPLTLRRVLTYPLEPALVRTREWVAGSYRIPRHHLPEIHKVVLDGLGEETARSLEVRIAGATSRDADLVMETGRELWPAASALLGAAAAERRGADPHLRISFRLAAHLLAMGDCLVPAIWRLPPRPIVELEPWAKRTVTELLGRAAERGREAFMLVTELLVGLCESPMSILRPALDGDCALPFRERAQCVVAIVDNTLGDLGRAVEEARAARDLAPGAVATLVLKVVSITESLQGAPANVRFDRYSIRRLLAATAELAERTVAALLEGRLLADFADEGEVAEGAAARAEEAARAIFRIRLVARQLGLVSKLDYLFRRAEREFAEAFDRFVERRRARQGGLSPVDLDVMDRIRILEILFGSGKAVEIWRAYRARAQGAEGRVAVG